MVGGGGYVGNIGGFEFLYQGEGEGYFVYKVDGGGGKGLDGFEVFLDQGLQLCCIYIRINIWKGDIINIFILFNGGIMLCWRLFCRWVV